MTHTITAAGQPYDATLTSIAALGTAANKMLYTTDVDVWAEADLTAAGRALNAGANAAAQCTTLGLGTGNSVTFTGATLSGRTAGRFALYTTGGQLTDDSDFLWVTGSGARFPGVGVGAAAQSAIAYNATKTFTDTTGYGYYSYLVFRLTAATAKYGYASYAAIAPSVADGQTNNGFAIALNVYAQRNWDSGITDNGTLGTMYGSLYAVGHSNAVKAAYPTTTAAFAFRLYTYIYTGIIGTLYQCCLSSKVTMAVPSTWAAAHAYVLGNYCKPTVANGHYYCCTRAGTSGGTEPVWGTTNGGTQNDPDANGVQWTCVPIPAITTFWGIYQEDATAKNYFAGNVLIGVISNPTSAVNAIVIYNGTAPAGGTANTTVLYSSGGEGYWMDAAGNATLQTPHAKDAPESLYTRNPGRENVSYTYNEYTGEIFWENHETGMKVFETADAYNKRYGLKEGHPKYKASRGKAGWDADEIAAIARRKQEQKDWDEEVAAINTRQNAWNAARSAFDKAIADWHGTADENKGPMPDEQEFKQKYGPMCEPDIGHPRPPDYGDPRPYPFADIDEKAVKVARKRHAKAMLNDDSPMARILRAVCKAAKLKPKDIEALIDAEVA